MAQFDAFRPVGSGPAPAERRAERFYPPPGRRVFVRNPGAMLEAQLRISVRDNG